jgi:diadenosine tetraphosphate (Ap4A) HIT family hydrolase
MPTSDPQPATCVFCAILSGAAPATFLHEDDLVVAVMDIRPVQPEIAHVHIHLIPRQTDDGFGFRFPPGYGMQPERSELQRLAGEIRPDGPSTSLPGTGGD